MWTAPIVVSLLSVLALPWIATAADPCMALTWAYPVTYTDVAFFVYVRREEESFRFAIREGGGGQPAAMVDDVAGPEQSLPCHRLYLPGPGVYYVTVTAVRMSFMEESPPAEVARLEWTAETIPRPTVPLPLPPAPVVDPFEVMPPPAPPPRPPVHGTPGRSPDPFQPPSTRGGFQSLRETWWSK